MKFYIISAVILSIFFQLDASLSAFGKPLFKTGFIHAAFQVSIIDSLKNALFSNSPDFTKAKNILKQIRANKNVSLLDPLERIHQQVQNRISKSFERRIDPYRSMQYETEATIIWLNLEKDNITSLNEKTTYLFNKIQTKLNEKKEVINAEEILLKDNATAITNHLFDVIDRNSNSRLKMVSISILKASSASSVEKETLKRVESYSRNFPVYANLISLLSEKGGVDTFNYLEKKIKTNNAEVKELIKVNLKNLGNNTEDANLKQRIKAVVK